MRKVMKKWMLMLVSVCMILSMCIPALAAGSGNAIKDVGDGVLQLSMVYEAKDGSEVVLKSGSCFLLNEKTVLTNYSLTHLGNTDDDTRIREFLEETYDVDFTNASQASKNIKYYVTVRRDMRNEAVILENVTSESIDLAVLTLNEAINGREPVILGYSEDAMETDDVYSLGFERVAALVQDLNLYTKDDIDIQRGIISKAAEIDTIPVFQHTATVKPGTYGGPLVDSNGYIIGLNSEYMAVRAKAKQGLSADSEDDTTTNYYAVQIEEIKEALDPYAIAYSEPESETETEPDTTPEPTELMKAQETLQAAITEAKGMDLDGYTEDSVKDYEKAIDDAQEVLDSSEDAAAVESAAETLEDAQELLEEAVDEELVSAQKALEEAINSAAAITEEEYTSESYEVFKKALDNANGVPVDAAAAELNAAADSLTDAMDGLEVKPAADTKMIVVIAIVAVIVIILIIIIILAVKGSGKKKSGRNGGNTDPVRPVPTPPVPPAPTPVPTPVAPTYGGDTAPTSLLKAEAGATDILGGAGPAGNASLIRKKTGEKVVITTAHFAIGRELGKVNYCISDNTTVGRVHAVIVKKGADYVLIDQKSTNGSFVNNVRLTPGEEKVLKSGDTIKLSDEVLEFVLK